MKLSAAYLAGVFTVLLCVLSAGGHAALISFAGGIVLTLAAVLLWSSSRPPKRPIIKQRTGARGKGKTPPAAPAAPTQMETDLCSALVNFQVPRREAAAAAAAAIRQAPEADFPQLFRIALRARKAAA